MINNIFSDIIEIKINIYIFGKSEISKSEPLEKK